jgi:hypothetical protein
MKNISLKYSTLVFGILIIFPQTSDSKPPPGPPPLPQPVEYSGEIRGILIKSNTSNYTFFSEPIYYSGRQCRYMSEWCKGPLKPELNRLIVPNYLSYTDSLLAGAVGAYFNGNPVTITVTGCMCEYPYNAPIPRITAIEIVAKN